MPSMQNKHMKHKIDELVDSEGGEISGDRNVTNDSEIETGPVQKPWNDDSDYEKGMPTTTDRTTRYRQNIPWFAVYSYRSATGRGIPVNEANKMVLTKEEIEKKIKEDLVKKSKSDREVINKDYDNKTDKVIDIINDTELNDEQLAKIKKAVLAKMGKKDG